VKTTSTVPLPSGSEQLRERITLLGTAWMFVGLKHSHREYLRDLSPQVWVEYLDYLLGRFVYKLAAVNSQGEEISWPRWTQLLQYEHAIRSAAMKRVQGGVPLGEALRAAWNDPVVKERYFTTPIALEPKVPEKRKAEEQQQQGPTKHKVALKGKGKKGDGKGKMAKGDCADRTPDGKSICFAWNNVGSKCSKGKKCRFMHVCGRCFKDGHPAHLCKEGPKTA
jgi:hypothetical protein